MNYTHFSPWSACVFSSVCDLCLCWSPCRAAASVYSIRFSPPVRFNPPPSTMKGRGINLPRIVAAAVALQV